MHKQDDTPLKPSTQGLFLLFYFATRFHLFLRSDHSQLTIKVFRRQDHTFRYNSFQFAGSQVSDKANLFSDQLFRSIMLGDTGNDRTFLQPVVNTELQ